jgi:hypothetical protein
MTPPDRPKVELDGAGIVLVGSFNPAIFQPSWFASKQLLRETDAQNVPKDQLLVTSELTTFSAGWLRLEVRPDRFSASTTDPSQYLALRDLTLSTFALLEHTPFGKMGLNTHTHVSMPSTEQWHAFGHLLAPKAVWQDLFEGHIGMRSLTIEAKRAGCPAKFTRVKVEPSLQVNPGVYIEVNEHHELEGADSAQKLLAILKSSWEEALAFSRQVRKHLLIDRTL